MFTVIMLAVNALIITFCGYKFVKFYREAEGTTWQRLITASQNSASMLWGYTVTLAGDVIAWSEKATEFFNFPEVQKFLTEHVTPTRLGIVMIAIGVISIVARLRSLLRVAS